MKALLSIMLAILANLAVQAASFAPPPSDTGIKLRIKEIEPHPRRPAFDLVTVEVTNTAKVDYWVRRRKGLEEDPLFSETNPKNYAYLLADDHSQIFRKASKWEHFDGYHMDIGELMEKLEPGKNLVFRIPIDRTTFKISKAIIVTLFFARDPEDPSSIFYLLADQKEEKAQQDVAPNGP